jgi:hypothetical protein
MEGALIMIGYFVFCYLGVLCMFIKRESEDDENMGY